MKVLGWSQCDRADVRSSWKRLSASGQRVVLLWTDLLHCWKETLWSKNSIAVKSCHVISFGVEAAVASSHRQEEGSDDAFRWCQKNQNRWAVKSGFRNVVSLTTKKISVVSFTCSSSCDSRLKVHHVTLVWLQSGWPMCSFSLSVLGQTSWGFSCGFEVHLRVMLALANG